jgi:DNA-directed RNA polymerase subunit RPC12/RpoP
MRCPYCGDRRTEVLKTVYRGHNSYRHRRCPYCGSRFSTQERPVRWSRVERKWPGPRPLRKGWGESADTSSAREMRSGDVWSGFQGSRNQAPCGPYRAGAAHPAIECWQSRPPRKPSVYLRDLPVQASSRPQAVHGG